MKYTILVFAVAFLISVQAFGPGGYVPHPEPTAYVRSELSLLDQAELPENFTWADVNGTNYLTITRNQHIPIYCGGCWAHATISALGDRIKIGRKAAWPDVNLAPQILISCSVAGTCRGGDPLRAYKHIQEYGISDESCSNYQARGRTNGLPCSEEIYCKHCDSTGECSVPDEWDVWYVDEYGPLKGEQNMMNEIYQRGPISCGFDGNLQVDAYTGGILQNSSKKYTYNHIITVYGWGVEDGINFWYVRNSWGAYWGNAGHFKINRGNNTLGIEKLCSWATLKSYEPSKNYSSASKNNSKKAKKDPYFSIFSEDTSCFVNRNIESHVKSPLPFEYFDPNDIPLTWDWRNASGINYLSWTKSESSLHYCASCWAQAASSSLADRINIGRKNAFPQIGLAPQSLINCNAGGDCKGGDPMGVYKYAFENGVVEDSCQDYTAANPTEDGCSSVQVCKTCNYPAPKTNDSGLEACWGIENPPKWYVSEYGRVSGSDKMKAEIFARGPISCSIELTPKFKDYTSGVYSEWQLYSTPNHVVSVVGWGLDENGQEYWIARNSWGEYWGERGFFRVKMGKNNMGIENDCSWAVPIIPDSYPSTYASILPANFTFPSPPPKKVTK